MARKDRDIEVRAGNRKRGRERGFGSVVLLCIINVISFGDFFRDCKKYLIAFQLCLNNRLTSFEYNSWLRWSPGQLGSVK